MASLIYQMRFWRQPLIGLCFLLFIISQAQAPFALAAFAQVGTGPTKSKASDINIQADQQLFDATTSKTVFKGRVNVKYKDIRINSAQAVLEMTPTGEPQIANFVTRPSFPRPKARKINALGKEDIIDADTIRIYLTGNAMRAEGNVVSYVTSVATDPFTIRSDVQQYDNTSKSVAALGGVTVNYQNTIANSPKALLTMGTDGKAEKITFLGGSRLRNTDGDVNADKITLMVANGNMIAEKNVVTNSLVKDAKGLPSKVRILSDFQQYDKQSGTMLASGNAVIYYQDYIAKGPKATFKLKNNQVDKITFTGRASIDDNKRTITADTIIITMNPKHFDAYGNVKTRFQASETSGNTVGTGAKAGKGAGLTGTGGAKATASSTTRPAVKPLVEVGEE
jgi:lipopolysaccharide assembly outer membrane protein LptD (OstA)